MYYRRRQGQAMTLTQQVHDNGFADVLSVPRQEARDAMRFLRSHGLMAAVYGE